MTKKILLILGGLILVVAVAGGSFYGGMMFQRSQSDSIRNAFFADRGGSFGNGNGGGFAGGGGGGNGGFFGGGGGGGGAVGQIKSIDGDTITLSTPQSEIKVKLTDTTQILKTVAGERSDLQAGERIVVRGERDSSGTVTASNIQITVNPPNQGQ